MLGGGGVCRTEILILGAVDFPVRISKFEKNSNSDGWVGWSGELGHRQFFWISAALKYRISVDGTDISDIGYRLKQEYIRYQLETTDMPSLL